MNVLDIHFVFVRSLTHHTNPIVANIHEPQNNLTSLERINKADDQTITSILLYLNNGNNEGEVPASNWDFDTSLQIYLMHLAYLSITFSSL